MLHSLPEELFPAAKKTQKLPGKNGENVVRPPSARQMITVYEPLIVPLENPSKGAVSFERGEALRPSYSIRSGENGFFTVANADALYRVMRVASASELGQVLATVGLFGDDRASKWFPNNICYYSESDNSRQVFDLLYQPRLLEMQLSGLEPTALQELGSAKHQGELHTLSLLILLHRLRNLDIEAIDSYVDLDHFDPVQFFKDHSRPLLFDDIKKWEVNTLAEDIQILVSAKTTQELAALNSGLSGAVLFPRKQQACQRLLECVLKAVWTIPSLGSPLLFERDGTTFIRTGYYVAPLDLLVTEEDSITTWLNDEYQKWLQEGYCKGAYPCSFAEYRDYHICTGGFVDLRPVAILCTASNTKMNLRGRVTVARDEKSLQRDHDRLLPIL